MPGQTNYSAAKAGVAAMTVVWAKELARYGIRAAAIAPGFCSTEILAAMKPEMLARVKAAVPLHRLGEPAEMAADRGLHRRERLCHGPRDRGGRWAAPLTTQTRPASLRPRQD